jgi:hypothetical protein
MVPAPKIATLKAISSRRWRRMGPPGKNTIAKLRPAHTVIGATDCLHAGGFFCNNRCMSEQADDEVRLLARAFDRAWKRYYRPSRIGAISASVARPALAKHLIASAKQGVVSLDDLAQGGLQHLVSLTPEARQWGRLRVEGAGARFQQEWRVRQSTV